jgi:hypothetical protein
VKDALLFMEIDTSLNPQNRNDAKIIRKRYKVLSRKYHPNMAKNINNPDATRKFQELGNHYKYLESLDPSLYAAKKNKLTKKNLANTCKCLSKNKKDPSPRGNGYCPKCNKPGIIMSGIDGNLWKNKVDNKGIRSWIKMKTMTGGFVRDGSTFLI